MPRDNIWRGEIGETHYYCPHCQTFWDDSEKDAYYAHFESAYGPWKDPRAMTIVKADKESRMITVQSVQDSGGKDV